MRKDRISFSTDPIVARALRERARSEGKSVSVLVSEMLCSVLDVGRQDREGRSDFKVRPFALGLRPGIDPARLREVLNDIEVGQFSSGD